MAEDGRSGHLSEQTNPRFKYKPNAANAASNIVAVGCIAAASIARRE
jgi:hypothetical protein